MNPFKVSSLFLITFNLNMTVIVNVKASKADIALFKHSGNVCFGLHGRYSRFVDNLVWHHRYDLVQVRVDVCMRMYLGLGNAC